MKYLKTFEAINSNEINDLFSLWNSYIVFGPTLIGYKIDLEWEREDQIDDHGYTVDWSGVAIDDEENEWECIMSVDKMSDEVHEINHEHCSSISEKIDKIFSSYMKEKLEGLDQTIPDAFFPSGTVYRYKRIINTELDKDQVKEAIGEIKFDTKANPSYLYEYRYELRFQDGISSVRPTPENSIFVFYVQIDKNTYEIGIKDTKLK
jgi:hypothetical protein